MSKSNAAENLARQRDLRARIVALDVQISDRFDKVESSPDHAVGRVDEQNADDRERIHEYAVELVGLLDELDG